MAEFSSMLTWQDDDAPSLGPGLSRPKDGAKSYPYRAKIKFASGGQPMLLTFQAENATQAKKYVAARWPGSTVVELERKKK
jgi:hypothetical protein